MLHSEIFGPIDAPAQVVIFKNDYSSIARKKVGGLGQLLLESGITSKAIFYGSILHSSFWWPLGPISGVINAAKIIREFIQCRRVIFYQDNAFPFPVVARLLSKKPILYLGGSPVGMFQARMLKCAGYRLRIYVRAFLEFITSVLSIKAVKCIVAISHSCLRNIPTKSTKVYAPVPGYSLDKLPALYTLQKHYNNRSNTVLYVGRFSLEKGVDLLPAISKELKLIGSEARLRVVGFGKLVDKLLRGIDKDTAVIVGELDSYGLLAEYNDAKLTIMPSRTEGMPATMIESMLCGTPVLATPVGAIPDIIQDEINGYMIWKYTPKEMAKKIDEIIRNPKEGVSSNARNTIIDSPLLETHKIWKNIILQNCGENEDTNS